MHETYENILWCDLVVYFGEKQPLFIQRIFKDITFWKKIIPKLNEVYFCLLLPEIILKRKEQSKYLFLTAEDYKILQDTLIQIK